MNYELHDIFKSGPKVERVARPSREDFESLYLRRREPVVLTGVMDEWPCLTKWTNEYLKSTGGHRSVNVSQARYGVHFDRDRTTVPIFQPIGEFISQIERGEGAGLYAGNIPVHAQVPELASDIGRPDYFDESLGVPANVWIGPGGNVVPLHFDFTFNFLAQVRGRKTVLLFEPGDYKNLYPYAYNHHFFHFSETNVAQPDLARFPRMSRARVRAVHLEPGEMLFIPLFWWHAVFGYDFNISLNYWWRPTEKYQLRHPWQELGINYRKVKRSVRNFKNDYVKPLVTALSPSR